jgi:xylulokinase
MSQPQQLALGFDLSTQQLKVVAVDVSNLETYYEKSLTFETDLARFKTTKGVHIHGDEVYSPVEMWIDALDVILQKMEEEAFPFESVVVISGAGQVQAYPWKPRKAYATATCFRFLVPEFCAIVGEYGPG